MAVAVPRGIFEVSTHCIIKVKVLESHFLVKGWEGWSSCNEIRAKCGNIAKDFCDSKKSHWPDLVTGFDIASHKEGDGFERREFGYSVYSNGKGIRDYIDYT